MRKRHEFRTEHAVCQRKCVTLRMEKPQNIYYSVSKSLILTLVCSVFTICGYYLLINADNAKMIIGGICGLAFIIGVCIGLYSLLNSIMRRPVIKIYNDRVENFTFIKGWQTFYYCDVEIFTEIKKSGVRIIQIHFLDNMFRADESLNTGSIDNIRMVCDLLNQKLEDYVAD